MTTWKADYKAKPVGFVMEHARLDIMEVLRVQRDAKHRLDEAEAQLAANPVKQTGHVLKNMSEELKTEIEALQTELDPICLSQVKMPQAIFVRLTKDGMFYRSLFNKDVPKSVDKDSVFILVGEMAQNWGHVVVQDIDTGEFFYNIEANRFEIIPPHELKKQ